MTSSPGATCSRIPIWLARLPDGMNSPASWPSSPATRSLELGDGGVLAVDVVTDLGRGHGRAHGRDRAGQRVGAQVDDAGVTASPSISATRKASSRLCWWFSRGSHSVS